MNEPKKDSPVSKQQNVTLKVATASQAAAVFLTALTKEQKEERVYVLPLDANGNVLAKPIPVSAGHIDGTTQVNLGAIFREALTRGAEEIIVAHNHPSGDLTPSKADVEMTAKLREAAELLGVPVLDHLILADPNGYLSLAENWQDG